MEFTATLPHDDLDLRQRLFAGEVFLAQASDASRELVASVIGEMQNKLELKDIRKAHHRWSDSELFEHLGGLRRHFYSEPAYHRKIENVIDQCGLDVRRVAYDPVRIRVILPGGHRNSLAAPVYFPHRDTWYSHPDSLLVWWIPLHDLRNDETFEFFPDDFSSPVANDSEIFDYNDWIKDGPALKIGWQKKDSGITAGYPQALEKTKFRPSVGFSCQSAEQLIFSGAHFHQTLEQDFDTIRFSLDFRVVHLDDWAAGRGAPNVDNRSKGCTLNDYIQPS
jgi:hypothetical protein